MKKSTRLKIKKVIFQCGLGATVSFSLVGFNEISGKETRLGKEISISDIADEDDYLKQPEQIEKLLYKLNYSRECALALERHQTKKQEVLNNYKKCETLEDIFTRQKELESLKLTDEDKIYKDCPMPAELQHFVYEQSIINNKPYDFLMSIIYTETRGKFDASGLASYNPDSNTYDLGYTQQNTKASLPLFVSKYGVSFETGWDLVQNNDYANICAAFLMINEIDKTHIEYDAYEYAGCYNGWLDWRNYSISQDYVFNHFSKAYNEIYTDHHYIEDEKVLASNNQENVKIALKK